MQVKPVLQALVLADKIYEDKNSGKKVIAGTFNRILLLDEPAINDREVESGRPQTVLRGGMQAGSPSAYISLTDVCGKTKCGLQFVSLSENVVIFQTEFTVDCKDRLRTIEIVAPLPPLTVREPGTYAIEVVCEGEILGSHKIIVERAIPEEGNSQ